MILGEEENKPLPQQPAQPVQQPQPQSPAPDQQPQQSQQPEPQQSATQPAPAGGDARAAFVQSKGGGVAAPEIVTPAPQEEDARAKFIREERMNKPDVSANQPVQPEALSKVDGSRDGTIPAGTTRVDTSDVNQPKPRMRYADMYDILNRKPVDPEADDKARRRHRSRSIIGAVSDGVSALANLYFTTQYAPNVEQTSMSKKEQERWEKLKDRYRTDYKEWLGGRQRALEKDGEYDRWEQEYNRKIKKDRDDARQKAADKAAADARRKAKDAEDKRRWEADQERKKKADEERARHNKASERAAMVRAANTGKRGGGGSGKTYTLHLDKDEHYDTPDEYYVAAKRYCDENGVEYTFEKGAYGDPTEKDKRTIAALAERHAAEKKKQKAAQKDFDEEFKGNEITD